VRGAGGIIATTHDMTVWERALYGGALLPATQQAELLSVVWTTTGQPIERTSQADPAGFGLGVTQERGGKFGTFWFYEGGTFGFRTIHLYRPDSGVIMAIGLNSYVTPGSSDGIVALAGSVYDTLLSEGVIAPALAAIGVVRR
jgi:D-alanyl-D-alanine carboxypeptidase